MLVDLLSADIPPGHGHAERGSDHEECLCGLRCYPRSSSLFVWENDAGRSVADKEQQEDSISH